MFSKLSASIKRAWNGLPDSWRAHIVSGTQTFVSTFATEILAMIATSTDLSVSRMALIGALNVAIRAVIKTSVPVQK